MVVRSELTINPPSHSVLNDSGARVTKSAPVTMSRSGAWQSRDTVWQYPRYYRSIWTSVMQLSDLLRTLFWCPDIAGAISETEITATSETRGLGVISEPEPRAGWGRRVSEPSIISGAEDSKVWRNVQHRRLICWWPQTLWRTETSSEWGGGREDINKRGQNGPGLSGCQKPEGAGLESRCQVGLWRRERCCVLICSHTVRNNQWCWSPSICRVQDNVITQTRSSPGALTRVHMSDVSITNFSLAIFISGEGGMVLPVGYS